MDTKKPSLYAAIAIGVSSMVGSGWLFACYYAAKQSGPASILAWLVGAVLALILAFLLAEIVTLFQVRGLFSRLLTISHNKDYGFISAASNWLGALIVIPSEAEATIQYLSTTMPSLTEMLFSNGHLTHMGILATALLIVVYWMLNYWGMKSLAKTNNAMTFIKVVVPLLTAITIIAAAFHVGNFSGYKHSFVPYGGRSVFDSVISSGIFYAFFGFNIITIYATELKNPKRNIPIALVFSIVITLLIYLVLQVAFLGALDPNVVAKGWHHLDFTSPLAQLAQMLGLNILMIILYADAAVSPSGTAIIFTGSGSRMLTGMAMDKQVPSYFAKLNEKYKISRRSLTWTVIFSIALVLFFDNWQTIMILVSVFQLIASVAVPLSFTRLRMDQPESERKFRAPVGKTFALLIFVFLTYLLAQAPVRILTVSLLLHVLLFLVYCFVYYRCEMSNIRRAFSSSWTMFLYLACSVLFGYLHQLDLLDHWVLLASFIVITVALYFLMLNQRDYQPKAA
jgi:amino acid transporter